MKQNIVEHIMINTQQECIKRFIRNRSLIDNLSDVFNHLSENIRLILETNLCYHIFINKSIQEVDILASSDNIKSPKYSRLHLEKHDEYKAILDISQAKLRVDLETGVPELLKLDNNSYQNFVIILGLKSFNKNSFNLIIPFDFSKLDLGFFLIPNLTSERVNAILTDENIKTWIASVYYFLYQFLKREYNIILKETYLPSLLSSRWHRAAILYADIRNFAIIYENLNKKYQKDHDDPKAFILRDILNKYCREMANIIQNEAFGRIDRIYGTGIMAIFGEHEDYPSKASCSAVFAATKLIKTFLQLKVDFLERAFGKGYQIEYNENVDINMSVGIDYGFNLFEYLGDSNHMEYSVIGDHVNFAILLQQETAHLSKVSVNNKPILISKTIETCTRPWIDMKNKMNISIQNNEKGYTYDIFGIDQNSFNSEYYFQCMKNNSWEKAWESYGEHIPQ